MKNMTDEQIRDEVFEMVATQMDVDKEELADGTSFQEDLNADSLDTVELFMEMEDKFETTISDKRAESINTISHAIGVLQRLRDGDIDEEEERRAKSDSTQQQTDASDS